MARIRRELPGRRVAAVGGGPQPGQQLVRDQQALGVASPDLSPPDSGSLVGHVAEQGLVG